MARRKPRRTGQELYDIFKSINYIQHYGKVKDLVKKYILSVSRFPTIMYNYWFNRMFITTNDIIYTNKHMLEKLLGTTYEHTDMSWEKKENQSAELSKSDRIQNLIQQNKYKSWDSVLTSKDKRSKKVSASRPNYS